MSESERDVFQKEDHHHEPMCVYLISSPKDATPFILSLSLFSSTSLILIISKMLMIIIKDFVVVERYTLFLITSIHT